MSLLELDGYLTGVTACGRSSDPDPADGWLVYGSMTRRLFNDAVQAQLVPAQCRHVQRAQRQN